MRLFIIRALTSPLSIYCPFIYSITNTAVWSLASCPPPPAPLPTSDVLPPSIYMPDCFKTFRFFRLLFISRNHSMPLVFENFLYFLFTSHSLFSHRSAHCGWGLVRRVSPLCAAGQCWFWLLSETCATNQLVLVNIIKRKWRFEVFNITESEVVHNIRYVTIRPLSFP